MKAAIVYHSKHHSNTKKLLDAIAADQDVTLIDAAQTKSADLSRYDAVGFASGIYYSKFHKSVLHFAEECLPQGMPVFFLYTCGAQKDSYTKAITEAVQKHGARLLGEYGCLGFDTFGPFKLVGGIAKGHPSADEIKSAVAFYRSLKL